MRTLLDEIMAESQQEIRAASLHKTACCCSGCVARRVANGHKYFRERKQERERNRKGTRK